MWRSLPNRVALFLLLGVISYFLRNSGPRGRAAEAPPVRQIVRLIDDLSSDRFEVREGASNTLMELEEAIPLLRKARKSPDPEIRRRVTDILWSLAGKRAARGLVRAQVLGKEGHIVEAADRVAYWGELDKAGNGWKILTQFAEEVVARTTRSRYSRYFFWKAGVFRQITDKLHPKEISAQMIDIEKGENSQLGRKLAIKEGGIPLLRGEEISLKNDLAGTIEFHRGIIATSGDVQVDIAAYSLIIAGGNVEINGLRGSIVICDGDVKLHGTPGTSLIIARGKFTCASGKPSCCMVRSGNSLVLPDGKTIALKDDTPDPLALVKFFELADVGLSAEDLFPREKSDAKCIRLKDVRKDSPFASGLRAGDVITALEEKKTPTTEIFRRILRRKLAEGEPILTFTVRRSGKTLDMPIAMKD